MKKFQCVLASLAIAFIFCHPPKREDEFLWQLCTQLLLVDFNWMEFRYIDTTWRNLYFLLIYFIMFNILLLLEGGCSDNEF